MPKKDLVVMNILLDQALPNFQAERAEGVEKAKAVPKTSSMIHAKCSQAKRHQSSAVQAVVEPKEVQEAMEAEVVQVVQKVMKAKKAKVAQEVHKVVKAKVAQEVHKVMKAKVAQEVTVVQAVMAVQEAGPQLGSQMVNLLVETTRGWKEHMTLLKLR